jgi:hypothetical protein
VRRHGRGRIHDSRKMLAHTNRPSMDLLAVGVMLYELVTGGLPVPVDYNHMYDFYDRVPGISRDELVAMEPKEQHNVLVEAYLDRLATMVDCNRSGHNLWHAFLLKHIMPLDVGLARFLMRILRRREERATVQQLLRDPYITRKWRMSYLATTVTTSRLFKMGHPAGLVEMQPSSATCRQCASFDA